VPNSRTRRLHLLGPLLVVAVLATLAAAPAASAKAKTCGDAVVADWYGDGRVDKIYPRHCYQDAIRSLPVDVLDYSNAKEDILRALQYARRGLPDPGPSGGPRPATTDPGAETSAAESVDTSGPSALPIPLLVLGGLALLLLAAGGAGYLSRRAQARREGGPPDPS
jgi:hypothetical protein